MRVLTLGHRGCRGKIENTIPAFKRALRWADGVEMDVRVTGDGKIIVHHDEGFWSDGEYYCVSELTFAEIKRLHPLGKLVPSVEEVIRSVSGFFDFDVKEPEAVEPLLNLVEKNSLFASSVFSADNPDIVRKLISECPDCRVGFSIIGYSNALLLPTLKGLYSVHVPIDAVSYIGFRNLTAILRAARKRGLKIFLWNYRMDEVRWVPRLLPFVDAVISDDPARLRKAFMNGAY
ncbi:glycerophosphodiester phosphodiesterase family protein [Thermococcus kodakarensis]|uniref:glycerophosphodiester phosphodiesterase family protein n=1 Tax=Thermococcus kodakarensis TaxID=311400 RepID=UPI00018907D3|nr:glycerophosphodiester phosphodiesterase family protein [Thermococcus kodakarensis]WCN27372.1 glycerophosphodiester phosphodiesterase family protein [Thermococcus kodakarensis]WCN29662.1 glycerophosphodiester phosphodiesterase family protein [Thermococcus kodakarensis]